MVYTRGRGPLLPPGGADRLTRVYLLFPGCWPGEWLSTLTLLYKSPFGDISASPASETEAQSIHVACPQCHSGWSLGPESPA